MEGLLAKAKTSAKAAVANLESFDAHSLESSMLASVTRRMESFGGGAGASGERWPRHRYWKNALVILSSLDTAERLGKISVCMSQACARGRKHLFSALVCKLFDRVIAGSVPNFPYA
eukprot:3273358-Pleurochrysis_carterae.AAC.3